MSQENSSDSDDSGNRCRDWEMVSLTSSSTHPENGANEVSSEQFIFPPSRHEGLPIHKEEEDHEIPEQNESTTPLPDSETPVPAQRVDEIEGELQEEDPLSGLGIESPDANEDGVSERKGSSISGGEEEEEEEEEEEGGKEEDANGGIPAPERVCGSDKMEQSDRGVSPEKSGGEIGPGEGWWKRQAASLGQPNTLWSIAVAAALMGLVFLGHKWQYERWQNQQIRAQIRAKDEKISELLYQVARLKEAVSGRRKVPVVRSGSS